MLDELFDELLYGIVPDRPAVVYLLPTALLGAGLAAVADPFPAIAVAVGLLLSVVLFLAYEHTGLQQQSTDGDRSAADWAVVGAFLLAVVGVVVVGETNAVDVSVIELLGAVTGLLAGASVVEWLLPALSGVADR